MKKLYLYAAVMAIVLSSALVCYFWWSRGSSVSKPLITDEKAEKTDGKNEVIKRYDEWFSRDFSPEKQLFQSIRYALSNGQQIQKLPKINVDISSAWVAISLFQQGEESIRWVSKRNTPLETINRIIEKLRENQNFHRFDVSDPTKCRIMLEVITRLQAVDFDKLNTSNFNESRFEPGITGFMFKYQDIYYIYMPTDATVYSHLTLRHTLNFISKQIGIAQQTNRISERIKLLSQLPIEWTRLESVAFITSGEDVIALYRGYPMPAEFSADKILKMTKASVEWVLDNMYEDGRFLYYYDGVNDTVIDHLHPNRTLENNYYNLLRHNGGIILLLKMYELTGEQKYLTAAKKAIGFLIQNLRQREYEGRKAYYVFYNKKAKLGGAGTALAALMNYYRLTQDDKYNEYIYGLAEHILSRVAADGEMIGYYIHPEYNSGQPILEPTEDEKKQLFSFYYPGEALLGLAMFERYMNLPDGYRKQVRKTAKSALDFLVKERPVRYAELFEPLPSDGWLMQAVEE